MAELKTKKNDASVEDFQKRHRRRKKTAGLFCCFEVDEEDNQTKTKDVGNGHRRVWRLSLQI